jgi:RHS repeat-associated protein
MMRVIWVFALLSFGGVLHASTEWNAQEYDLYAGDFNGDGKTDILYIAKDPSMPSGIAASDGTGPNIAWQSWPSNFLGINWAGNNYKVIVADFNGDGKADILLQNVASGNSYLLITSSSGYVTGISQTIANTTMGLVWSAGQHKIIAGAFAGSVNGHPKSGLFLQATSPTGTDAVVLSDANGMFTSVSPAQTWTDGYLGFKWSTANANVFAGDFNGDGLADLLIQAKPTFVTIDYDVPFPVPNYPPNMNGVVLAQTGSPIFAAMGVQAWSRSHNGVDWSPLTNNVVIAVEGNGHAVVILQAKNGAGTSYELIGNATGAIFPASATALSSNVSLSAGNYHLIAANFSGGTGAGLYFQALVPGGANYVTDSVGSSITASVDNPSTVTGTAEPTSAGRTAGQFTVSPTGGVSYNIPIWTPPGARDIEPRLALHYTSGGPDGIMGPGWALSGVSTIARCGKTWASTGGTATTLGAPAPVTLATTDDLCIDGNRMRITTGTQGVAGSTYQTEQANFSNITAYGAAGNGPQYFIVQGKDGRTYEYGNIGNSRITASGSTTPYMWGIDKVSDREGNNMVFTYNPNAGVTELTLFSIQYTATPATGASYGYQVNFNYASSRSGGTIIAKSVAGGVISLAQQLSNIQVMSVGTLVRQYNLGYSVSPTTRRPMLNSVQECAGASGTDCIRPTTISYQAGAAGWSTAATATGLTGQYGFVPVDLNGDGIPDAVYGKVSGSNIHWYARIATETGYGPELDTGANTTPGVAQPNLIFGAFSGTGKQQFLAPVTSTNTWWVYSYNTATQQFTSANTKLAVNGEYQAVDYDGDGLPDIVSVVGVSVEVRRNITAPGGAVAFATSATTVYSGSGPTGNAGFANPAAADFNGDGRADFLIIDVTCMEKGHQSACTGHRIALLSNGFGAAATAVPAGPGKIAPSFGDWNGDGCTDLIDYTGNIQLSDCNGHFSLISNAVPLDSQGQPVATLAADWDGDGQIDLLYADPTSNTWFVQRSTGNGVAAAVSTGIPVTTTSTFFVTDRNSDGQSDLMYYDSAGGYAVQYYVHAGVNTPPDLATSITDGFGIQFSPTYVPISQSAIYTKGSSATFPDEDFEAPMYVVNQYTGSDGIGGTYRASFTYAGARLNLQGRGFEGFNTTTSSDNRNGLIRSTAYQQTFPYIGAVSEDDTFQPDGKTPISKTSNSYPTPALTAHTPQCSLCFFAAPTQTQTVRYEVGGTKNGLPTATAVTKYTYDPYGTVETTNATITDNDAASPFVGQSWNTLITNTIANYPSYGTWCIGRPTLTTTQKTAPGQPPLTRTVSHTLDPSSSYYYCRAITETIEPGSPLQVTTTFGFDGCGNTNSVSVVGLDESGVAMPARTTTSSYGTRCQLPETATNPLGQSTSTAYNYDLGVKSSAKDANGLTVSWQYDDFGRRILEKRPDLTSTTWSFTDCVSTSCWGTSDLRLLMTQTSLDANGDIVRTSESISDGMDRVRIQSGVRVLGVWTTQVSTYDALGRKTQFTVPYSASGNGYHVYQYDLLNRPTLDVLYTSSGTAYRSISLGYSGQTATVTDPKGNTITKVTDVNGKLRRVTDPPDGISGLAAGVTNYTYDSWDNLVKIVDATNITSTYSYNLRGFKIGTADADTGIWSFAPDSLNELKSQTDAKHQVTSFTYDLLGRMLTRLEPESTTPTQWVYGTTATAYNIGQVQTVTKPDGYSENHAYDSAGRPKTTVYTEDGVSYQFDYAYNVQGTTDTITYPTSTSGARFQLKYVYDSAGYLNQTQDAVAGTTFWTLTQADDNSDPTMEVLGNGVQVATAHTAWTNEIVSRTEGSAGSTTNLQNLSYTWDLSGNLQQRVDNRQGLTETFTNDALNRLSTVTLNGVQTLSVRYDQAGNITSKSDVGTYTYGDPAHPHAVTAAGSWTVGYDANGNMSSRAGGAITSYSYNLPDQIDYAGNSAQFNYDSNHQRWKQVAKYGATTETVHYIGGVLEVVTDGTSPTEYRHMIPAGSGTAIYTRRSDGSTGTYYATTDHLGSSDLVMDSSANVLVRESFSPFGARRGSNWQGIPTTGDYSAIQSTTRQGFTGHEMLDAVSLVHMNGRVYDPTLGRFLSADTVIQSLGSSQSINPFAYAWNAPLRYIDPTGHSLLGDIIGLIVAIIAIYFLQPELFYGEGATLSASTAFISGFAGGFFGALVSTGSLDAALTAGLIGGVTALAFYQVGSWAQGGNWTVPENVLAHAAVGCGSAVLSGGNCGRGALSAAISEAAVQSNLIKPAAIGTWGAVQGAAESGLLGGLTSEITGGSFDDGFSVSAAGYLFNSATHRGYQDPEDVTYQQLQAAQQAGAACQPANEVPPQTFIEPTEERSPGILTSSYYVPVIEAVGVGGDLEGDFQGTWPRFTIGPSLELDVHIDLVQTYTYTVSTVDMTYANVPWVCTTNTGQVLTSYVPTLIATGFPYNLTTATETFRTPVTATYKVSIPVGSPFAE